MSKLSTELVTCTMTALCVCFIIYGLFVDQTTLRETIELLINIGLRTMDYEVIMI